MAYDHSELYYFYRQLGVDVSDDRDQIKKNRSQNYNLGIILETCACNPETVDLEMTFHTPYGSRVIAQQYRRGTDSDIYLHQHDHYELLYVQSGTVNVNIETECCQYHAGDFVLINRFSRHLEQYDQDNAVVYLCFSKNLAQELTADLGHYKFQEELIRFLHQDTVREDPYTKQCLEFRQVAEMVPGQSDALIRTLVTEMSERQPGYLYVTKALLLRLFVALSDQGRYAMRAKRKKGTAKDRIFEAIREYIVAQNGVLVRSQLEKQLHFHADYLNKIVKTKTGMSLVKFAQAYRMKEAARLIGTTDIPIVQISQTLGFTNKTHFYRLFSKMYHMTPLEHRHFCNTRR